MFKRANGFFGHIRNNHLRSVCMFAGFAVSMQLAFAALLALPLTFAKDYEPIFSEPARYFLDFGWLVFLLSLFLFLASYFFHTAMTRLTTGFHYIQGYDDKRLENIVKNMAWTAGIPVPEIGIIETPALNSFACGLNQDDATLVVTRGLMNELDDDELQGVIAHEIVHIMNGDIGMMAAANASHSIVKLVNWMNPFQVRHGGLLESRGSGCLMFFLWPIIIPLVLTLALVGFAINLSSMVAGVTRYFVTSSREYIADAEAVRLTHNPAALISALNKIEGRSLIPHLDRMANAMMIDGPATGELASHPPIMERIQALMQYGGSMVHGAGQRKDTRSFGQRVNPTHFDGEMAKTRYRRNTAKSVVARVTSDNDSNIFSMPEGVMGRAMGFGLAFILLMSLPRFMGPSSIIGINGAENSVRVKPIIEASPIFVVIDLDRDGLETSRYSQSRAFMDFDKDGRPERTGWLRPDDGFLFHDKNNNRRIDLPHELIMTDKETAQRLGSMSSLKKFDRNMNGRIESGDRGYSQLMVWRNLGRDGKAEDNDTYSLLELGIKEIRLWTREERHLEEYTMASGGEILSRRWYTLRDPKSHKRHGNREPFIYEISFETDRSRYRDETGDIKKLTVEEYEAIIGPPEAVHNPGELTPAIGNIGDQLDIRPIDQEQSVASADKEKAPQLRGRRGSD